MKATKISLFSFNTPSMRAFHMTWIAFFMCFFGWFGLAPLMPLVRADLALTPKQVADSMIASVAGTIFARLVVGYLCDKIGRASCRERAARAAGCEVLHEEARAV